MNSMRGLDPRLQYAAETLLAAAAQAGYNPRVTSIRRTRAQQERLYRDFLNKTARGIPTLPAAPPGRSYHEVGRAFDVVCNADEGLAQMGAIWRSWGGRWFPSDPVHFEY